LVGIGRSNKLRTAEWLRKPNHEIGDRKIPDQPTLSFFSIFLEKK
jgi:hypothetical protein